MTASTPDDNTTSPHATPGDQEEVYYQGSPPVRAHWKKLVLYGLLGLLLIALGMLLFKQGIGPFWLKIVLIFVGLDVPMIPVILAKTIRYRISNYRIDFERGLLAKNIDTLELWHVEDLHFYQSLVDRMLGVGTITVLSRDETLPTLAMQGIPHPRPLYETLKQRVIAVKRQRGVIKMDPG